MAFQQYFSYIVVVGVIGGGNRSTRRKPLTCLKFIALRVVSITPHPNGIQTHNVSGDRHQLHR